MIVPTYILSNFFSSCLFLFNMFPYDPFCWGNCMQSAPRMPLIDTYCIAVQPSVQMIATTCVVALWLSIELPSNQSCLKIIYFNKLI